MLTLDQRKEEIEQIKLDYRDEITTFATANHAGRLTFRPTFIGEELHYTGGVCFARVFRKVREYAGYDRVRMTFAFDRQDNTFDYNSIYDEINEIFGNYLKFIRYFSGKRKVRIIDAHVLRRFPNRFMHWSALYFGYILLRMTDLNQFGNSWNKVSNDHKPISDVATMVHYFTKVVNPKYAPTDLIYSNVFTNSKRNSINQINDRFLAVLRDTFSVNHSNPDTSLYPSIDNTKGMYQSSVFRYLEKALVRRE